MIKAKIVCHNCLTVYEIPIPIKKGPSESKFICKKDKTVLVTFVTPRDTKEKLTV